MKTAFFHVTDLDSIVWYNKIDDMTVDEMRGRLMRTSPPNESMLKGTAWHSILEHPPEEIGEIERNGFKFKVDCDATILLPQIREIRANKSYLIDDIEVTLSGGCDGIGGNNVTDHKLTFRPNMETYFDSLQWRTYLDIFDADVFKYFIYAAKEDGSVTVITDVSELVMYRYPEMLEDIKYGIRRLLDFVKIHIPERIIER